MKRSTLYGSSYNNVSVYSTKAVEYVIDALRCMDKACDLKNESWFEWEYYSIRNLFPFFTDKMKRRLRKLMYKSRAMLTHETEEMSIDSDEEFLRIERQVFSKLACMKKGYEATDDWLPLS